MWVIKRAAIMRHIQFFRVLREEKCRERERGGAKCKGRGLWHHVCHIVTLSQFSQR
jgi:hypothetical protein